MPFVSTSSPIAADVVIVDEASMVDIHLADRLMAAVSPKSRVILLGDKHQLAAVGPGAVFAEISDAEGPLAQAGAVVELVKSRRFGEGTPIAKLAQAINHQGEAAALPEGEVFERVLEAFDKKDNAGDGQQHAVLHTDGFGAPDETLSAAEQKREREFYMRTGLTKSVRQWIDRELMGYVSALQACREAYQCGVSESEWKALRAQLWEALSQFRVLAAQRRGEMSVMAVNAYADEMMRRVWPLSEGSRGLMIEGGHYPGEVVIVRRNDEGLGVHNGDVGIVLPKYVGVGEPLEDVDPVDGALVEEAGAAAPERMFPRSDRQGAPVAFTVYFGDVAGSSGEGHELAAALLPAFDVAWAMTIHQSQGSEFERVAVLLPFKETSELATRELLYTAVTRTKRTVDVFGSVAVLRRAVARQTVRDGSLGRRLALFLKSN